MTAKLEEEEEADKESGIERGCREVKEEEEAAGEERGAS